MVAVMLLAGCSGSEEGTANTAPIRAETTTVAVATDAPVTAGVVAVVETTVVASVDSVPTPVGEDYRWPVLVTFVPKTDVERDVLASVSELFVKYRRLELWGEKRQELLEEVLAGKILDEWIPKATLETDLVTVPSSADRIVIESMVLKTQDSVEVTVCQLDGSRLYVRAENGEFVLDNDQMITVHKRYIFEREPEGWRITLDERLGLAEDVDECEK